MDNRIASISKTSVRRAVFAAALGCVFGVGPGAGIPQAAYAASEPAAGTLSADVVATIQAQIKTAIGNVESQGLTGAALDAALSAAITQEVVSDVSAYGHAGEIADIVIATAGIPAADIGTGLGDAAIQLAKSDSRGADAIARAVRNEGSSDESTAFESAANLVGDTHLADIVKGLPEVTGSTVGGVGVTFGGSTPPPPPAPPPPCSNPTCS